MKILFKIIVSALILVGSFNLRADANPDLWPYIHERMFEDAEIVEADFIKIDTERYKLRKKNETNCLTPGPLTHDFCHIHI